MHQGSGHSSVLLAGPNVTLREFEAGDFDSVHAYARDPGSWTYVEWHANTPAETREYLERAERSRLAEPRTIFTLATTVSGTGDVVGAVELRLDDARADLASLGYIVDRRYQGKGYATEAATLIVRFGIGSLGLRRIEATCDPRNLASTRVLVKAGFRYETSLNDHRDLQGERGDSLLFSLASGEVTAHPDPTEPSG
jgi:RimJ/RimL family protein N-acetyltransferase